jgi:hypothetical protein
MRSKRSYEEAYARQEQLQQEKRRWEEERAAAALEELKAQATEGVQYRDCWCGKSAKDAYRGVKQASYFWVPLMGGGRVLVNTSQHHNKDRITVLAGAEGLVGWDPGNMPLAGIAEAYEQEAAA